MPRKGIDAADVIRIRHMIDAASEALSFVKARKRQDLDKDRQLTLSLIKEIEIIGEAANRVSEEMKEKHGDVPWSAIIGTRNRLIHGYFDVDEDVVWNTVKVELPSLIEFLKRIVD